MSCKHTRDWLHRDAATLDDAQRLQLDDHLAGCETCRGDRERLRLVREVGTSLPVPPAGAREYQRAIARAFLEGSRAGAPRAARWRWLVPVAVGAAVAVAIAVAVTRGDEPVAPQVAPAPPPLPPSVPVPPAPPLAQPSAPAPQDVVVDGVLHAEGATLQAGDAVPDDVELRSDAPARVRVASVDVEIAPHTHLRKRDRAVLLDAGKLEIEAAGEVVRVVTERFELELTDGRVVIEPAGVHVERGSARVLDPRGKELARLDTGGRWPPAKQPPRAKPQPSTSELMARARAHFAAGERDDAERVATSALARPLARADEVEARMFLADLAQASGNLALAARRYEEVATKFADLPAAESALYAAARVEARRGRDDAARVLFDRYLARYPQGRYADDVRRQRRIR